MDLQKSKEDPSDNTMDPPRLVTQRSYSGQGENSILPWKNYSGCPRVTTLIRIDPVTKIKTVIPIRCKTWRCPYCSKVNAEQLQRRILAGKPTHFITLTTRPAKGETPKACHNRTRPLISRLLTRIRKTWGKIECAIILELTRRGYPHWHLLARTSFIHQSWLADEWEKLTGARIVDIRTIKNPSVAASYCCKYITKNAQRTAERKIGRVISFTRRYLIEDKSKSQSEGIQWIRSKQHPLSYLQSLPAGYQIDYFEGVWHAIPFERSDFPDVAQIPSTVLLEGARYVGLWNEFKERESGR